MRLGSGHRQKRVSRRGGRDPSEPVKCGDSILLGPLGGGESKEEG